MRTYKHSASTVTRSQNTANAKSKPVINSSKHRSTYDPDGEFRDLSDRKETRIYALEILDMIKRAKGDGWLSGASIRRSLLPEKVRMWEAAISLLCDDVETKNVLVPHFRYCKRELKELPTRKEANAMVFARDYSKEVLPELKK